MPIFSFAIFRSDWVLFARAQRSNTSYTQSAFADLRSFWSLFSVDSARWPITCQEYRFWWSLPENVSFRKEHKLWRPYHSSVHSLNLRFTQVLHTTDGFRSIQWVWELNKSQIFDVNDMAVSHRQYDLQLRNGWRQLFNGIEYRCMDLQPHRYRLSETLWPVRRQIHVSIAHNRWIVVADGKQDAKNEPKIIGAVR